MKLITLLFILHCYFPSLGQTKNDSLKLFLNSQFYNIPYSVSRYEIRNGLLKNNLEISKDENNSSGNAITGTIVSAADNNLHLVSYTDQKPSIKFFFSYISKDKSDSRYLFFPYEIDDFKECEKTFTYLKNQFIHFSDSISIEFIKDNKENVVGEKIILIIKKPNLNQSYIDKVYGQGSNIPFMEIAELKREFYKGVPNIVADSYQISLTMKDWSIKYIK